MKILIDMIHTQNQQKVNIWTGILNEAIIGPFFIEDNLNADNYLAMLQDKIVPAIRNIARQNFNETFDSNKMRRHLSPLFTSTPISMKFFRIGR